jgi:hypothetical protein
VVWSSIVLVLEVLKLQPCEWQCKEMMSVWNKQHAVHEFFCRRCFTDWYSLASNSCLWVWLCRHQYCNVLGVLFTTEVYFNSKTQDTTIKYNQQLSKHIRTIHRRAIGPLSRLWKQNCRYTLVSAGDNCWLWIRRVVRVMSFQEGMKENN